MEAKYFGAKVRQRVDGRTCEFFIFVARAKDVAKWAGIKRSQDFVEGTQRVFRKARANAVAKFLRADDVNTVPNNILLAFGDGVANFDSAELTLKDCINAEIDNNCDDLIEWGFLRFDFEERQAEHLRPAMIVDGQHRLAGIASFAEEDLPVLIVSLVNATLQEQAFQFIVINDKAVRVSQANAKSIIADQEEPALIERLLKSGVKYGEYTPLLRMFNSSEGSPFYQMLRWDQNRDGKKIVDLSAVEQMASYTSQYFGRYVEDDFDSLVDIIFTVWKTVRAQFGDFWEIESEATMSDAQKKFFSKVNLLAFHEFLMENVKKGAEFDLVSDIYDTDAVSAFILERPLKLISPEFWKSDWRVQLRDNSDVRRKIKENLEATVDNIKMGQFWSTDLDLIRGSAEESQG
jgi:DGQHR domain-containing protein